MLQRTYCAAAGCRTSATILGRPLLPLQRCSRIRLQPLYAQSPDTGDAEEWEGLTPEEDYEVPGNYMDAMSSNTKLGKAVRAAVEELEHLGDLETDVLQQCDDLLKKLGMKGSIFGSSPPPQTGQENSSSGQ